MRARQPAAAADADLSLLQNLAVARTDLLQLRIGACHRAVEQQALADGARIQSGTALERSQLLLQASARLAGATSLQNIVSTVQQLSPSALQPAHVAMLLDEHVTMTLTSDTGLPAQVGQQWRRYPVGVRTPATIATRTGSPVLLPDIDAVAMHTPDTVAVFEQMGWQSAVSVLLAGENAPVGALTSAWKHPVEIDEAAQAVLLALGGCVAQALARVLAFQDRQTAASIMQKALLTPLPHHYHLRMAARYQQAQHANDVGGDW